MTSWSVSRHPAWDMMYFAGLTVREISVHCHANVATIHRHLLVREQYSLGLRAAHETALVARGQDRLTTRWRRRLAAALEFQAIHGGLPKGTSTIEIEKSLAQWVSFQRNAYHRGKLFTVKVILLDALEG